MIKKEFGTLQVKDVQAVIDYFSTHCNGKAIDIGVSGSFMSSLCARDYAIITGTAEDFVLINDNYDLYKRVEVNIYALKVTPSALVVEYNTSRERMATVKKTKAQTLIECAKRELTEAEQLLKGI